MAVDFQHFNLNFLAFSQVVRHFLYALVSDLRDVY
ncbi:Uncharacterised protein [Vibrio cholerae]|nr:Uncharacterised protein [Vibrio cholerae]